MRLSTVAVGSAVTILALSGLVASTASATPGSGATPSHRVDATLDKSQDAKADGIKLKLKDDAAVRSFTLTYAPGAYSGWHQHPGIVIAVVKEGAVLRKLPCQKAERFVAGQAFTEVGPHFVRNANREATGASAVLLITQVVPAETPLDEYREDLPKPRCRS